MMCESMQTMDNSADLMDQKYNSMRLSPAASSRILYDMPCKVCRDHSSGKHYGIYACDGCAGFFKRSIRRARQYVCKSQKQGHCTMDKTHRNQCRACRLRKCFEAGMNKDAVQHERGPRNSTLRRHMALYKEAMLSADMPPMPHELLMNTAALTGFPGVPQIPLPAANLPPHHPLNAAFQQAPIVLDLSRPRVPHNVHATYPPAFPPTAAYMNALASRALPPTPPLMAAEHLKETAADQLLRNINWIKGVPAFIELPMSDQMHLLEESWKEFFIIALAQNLMPINFAQLLFVYESEQTNRDMCSLIAREVHNFQDVLNQLRQLNLDFNEYNCLRAIALFRKPISTSNEDLANSSICTGGGSPNSSASNESRSLVEAARIASLHEDSRNNLLKYTFQMHPNQPLRFQTILGVISLANKISSLTIEELFFRKTIGDISIVRLILDLYTQTKQM